MTLLTGATGFIGSHILRKLTQNNQKVRVLVRKESRLDNLRGVYPAPEIAYGDLRDKDSLKSALKGCRFLYHTAADYSLWSKNPKDVYETNVQGTSNILEAARSNGIEKIVYTSSVGTIGIPKDGRPGNEDTPASLADMVGHYKRSKYVAEEVALRFAREGLAVVIVNPTTPVGSMDIKPTPTGQMLVDFLNGRMTGFIDTGLNIIDVEDVADGHILACQKGVIGERYILGNKNMSLRDIFKELSNLTGIVVPKYRFPYLFVLSLGCLNTLSSHISGQRPRIPLEGVRMAKRYMYFDSSKAVRELGLSQNTVVEAFRKAVNWFKENGYVK